MTEQEAIAKIEYRIETASSIAGRGVDGRAFEDLDIAIKSLEEIQQYRALGTVEELQEAVKKQRKKKILKRILYTENVADELVYKCPNCGAGYNRFYKGKPYCMYCGQALDFSEVKE